MSGQALSRAGGTRPRARYSTVRCTASRTRAPHWLGLAFGSQLQVYSLPAFWLLASAAVMYAFMRTPVGRLANAVRDNAERVEFIGYNPQRIRFIVFRDASSPTSGRPFWMRRTGTSN